MTKNAVTFDVTVTICQLQMCPLSNVNLFVKCKCSKARDYFTEKVPVKKNVVDWNEDYVFRVKIPLTKTGYLEDTLLRLSVRQETIKGFERYGFVQTNLSCFPPPHMQSKRKYTLSNSLSNSLLVISIQMVQVSGPPVFKSVVEDPTVPHPEWNLGAGIDSKVKDSAQPNDLSALLQFDLNSPTRLSETPAKQKSEQVFSTPKGELDLDDFDSPQSESLARYTNLTSPLLSSISPNSSLPGSHSENDLSEHGNHSNTTLPHLHTFDFDLSSGHLFPDSNPLVYTTTRILGRDVILDSPGVPQYVSEFDKNTSILASVLNTLETKHTGDPLFPFGIPFATADQSF
ncbi:putative C2 domain containing protein [Blattamonas nauphoetae]|uniref:C2 domain containing protein n=1 Tax=Blattamonas nauphoetae TaxID=2049346 RepID=A0ABQ9X3U7_9EUKA|nr:putative C2 domain containing protein [Blattamonas nauphoetae]